LQEDPYEVGVLEAAAEVTDEELATDEPETALLEATEVIAEVAAAVEVEALEHVLQPMEVETEALEHVLQPTEVE
jgi:hypothetical protein